MPSQLHESHLLLFRNQPTLAVALIRDALHVEVPRFTQARIVSADFTDVQPAEYRADMVIQLIDEAPVFGIVLEVQLSVDVRKQFVWPVYVANLRARLECPVCLLAPSGVPQVLDESLARGKCRSEPRSGEIEVVF